VDATPIEDLKRLLLNDLIDEFLRVFGAGPKALEDAIFTHTMFLAIGAHRPVLLAFVFVECFLPRAESRRLRLSAQAVDEYKNIAFILAPHYRLPVPPALAITEQQVKLDNLTPGEDGVEVSKKLRGSILNDRIDYLPRHKVPLLRTSSAPTSRTTTSTSRQTSITASTLPASTTPDSLVRPLFIPHKKGAGVSSPTTSDASMGAHKAALTLHGQCVVLCSGLLSWQPNGCYSTLRILPGPEVALTHVRENVYKLLPLSQLYPENQEVTGRAQKNPLESVQRPSTNRTSAKQPAAATSVRFVPAFLHNNSI
jgi:hypothetical protein